MLCTRSSAIERPAQPMMPFLRSKLSLYRSTATSFTTSHSHSIYLASAGPLRVGLSVLKSLYPHRCVAVYHAPSQQLTVISQQSASQIGMPSLVEPR